MRSKLRIGAAILGMTTAAVALSPHRLIVVVSASGDARAQEQIAALRRETAALDERDVVVQNISPDAARRLRPELGVRSRATFEVLLVGKDGEVKLRRETPVAVAEIAGLIDAMPMRQDEMRRQKDARRP